jgi:rhodanese-related sulfurtransferase
MLRNRYLTVALVLLMLITKAQHPFKYDNTVYKAVYLIEAFRIMDTMQSYLLLDVRSPGEYADTSRATALNIGRFKGSVNITIDSVPAHLTELKKYINKPVFVYCSHSQRSRRVSKLLAENGFRKVYNINGGMTLVNELDASAFPYKNKYLITNLNYQNISAPDAFRLIKNEPRLVIIDIRTRAEFTATDSLQRNNVGHLKNAINIPQDVFAEKFDSYKIPANSPVLLYDLNGYNSMDVVDILRAKGFTRIYNLFEGLNVFISNHELKKYEVSQLITGAPTFQMLDAESCIQLIMQQPGLVTLDTRSAEEYHNKSKNSYMNLGRIRGAINVPTPDSLDLVMQKVNHSNPLLVYGSGSDLGMEVCQMLVNKGFQQVNFLNPGFYHFVWATANVEDCKEGRMFLIDHEGLY